MKSFKVVFEKFEKKDYVYWICILLFLLILSWSIRINSTSELLDKISFGVGLSSLFLAIIAIFYSIVKGEQSSQQSIVAQQTLHEISRSIIEFNIIKEDIRKSVNNINELKTEIKETRSSMNSSFNNLFEILYKYEDSQKNNKTNAPSNGTSELMEALKTVIFSSNLNGNVVNEVYYDVRFKLINEYFPESMLYKMAKTSAKELGLSLVGFYTGETGLIYAAFQGPDNIDFEKEFLKTDTDLLRSLQVVNIEKVGKV
jgi:hypothetical protein